jgi:hypothetical protein
MIKSMHFLARNAPAVVGDARTEGLEHLDTRVVDYLRDAVAAVDTDVLASASVRLMYASDSAAMSYGYMHEVPSALRELRNTVDAISQTSQHCPRALGRAVSRCVKQLRQSTLIGSRPLFA